MTLVSRYALTLGAVLVMAIYTPLLFDMAFGERIKTTHLFYSPVIEKFVWRDKLLELPESGEKHHARFVQMDEDGNRYSRKEFEKLLPFIYYRNMDLWGRLPLELQGRRFDKETIRANRQVTEFRPEWIAGGAPREKLRPLLESVPGKARLVFPEERFRLGDEMEFINADFNRRDDAMTEEYTRALREKGFTFPGKAAFSNPTILKPYDSGVFLLDAEGALFHVRKVQGRPEVVRTPVSPQSGVRSIRVAESSRREYYGLLLTGDGTLNLLGTDGYRLTPLPLEGYDPDTMDFKMIVNPLYRTAVYSDDSVIRAVVMNSDYQPIARYRHIMPGAGTTAAEALFHAATPFEIRLHDPNSGYLTAGAVHHGWPGLLSCIAALAAYFVLVRRRRMSSTVVADGALVGMTGVYGLIAVLLLPMD